MIVREFYSARADGVNLYRSFSEDGFKIRKVGTDEIYDEAIDVENAGYIYEETDVSIEGAGEDMESLLTEDAEVGAAEALAMLTGEAEA